ncbi:hypothetical protein PITC_032490 [Penicillium italicum]|uniref:F-box domain-containing protein n=1 Tax=Penicillium italicum TaxID=40296 RepID=A0A0A2L770_PENIT|nr:hypothetical protein PITC_032490 [Penicillium italicum]
MTVTLPLELLLQIAKHLKNDETSLAPCTSVCRSWQAAFEPFLYSNIAVYCGTHKQKGQRGISLTQFQKLTSGDGAIRQTWVRTLEYDILTPYEILDWTTRKEIGNSKDYCVDNYIRKANDLAFQNAMVMLFQVLRPWDQSGRLKIYLYLRGYRFNPAPEPYTQQSDIAGEYRWNYTNGHKFSIPPYRAQFINEISDLASIPCIEKLSFLNRDPSWDQHHQISTGAVQTILQCCPRISELELDLDEWVRPDHLGYIQARRAALSSLIGSTPRSLRVLHYEGNADAPWKPAMPPLNVIPSGVDSMSSNLRDLSVHLRELKLMNTTIAYDFLCPLDKEGKPEPGSLHLNWPNLEILELESVPPWLPSGEPTFHNTPEAQAEIDNVEDWEDVICDAEAGWGWPELRTEEHFHRLLISLGYAARRMPRLKTMKFELESHHKFNLHLRNTVDEIIFGWKCHPGYQPDSRVAKAWNFTLDDVRTDFGYEVESFVVLRSWPPDTPI